MKRLKDRTTQTSCPLFDLQIWIRYSTITRLSTGRKKICPTKPTVQVSGYGTAQSKVNVTSLQVQKFQTYQKPYPIKKKVSQFLSNGFADLTHRRREPPSLPTLSQAFISTARLFSSSNFSPPHLFPFFLLLSFLFEISRVSKHFPRSTSSKHPHIRGIQFSLVFVRFSLLFS